MGNLNNPALAGDMEFDTIIYGAPPLAYPASLSQYAIYNTPDSAYVTGRINISAFANLGASTPWPFLNTNVPLNGHVCVPRGRGPFPLAVFAHGNHNPLENSTPGRWSSGSGLLLLLSPLWPIQRRYMLSEKLARGSGLYFCRPTRWSIQRNTQSLELCCGTACMDAVAKRIDKWL